DLLGPTHDVVVGQNAALRRLQCGDEARFLLVRQADGFIDWRKDVAPGRQRPQLLGDILPVPLDDDGLRHLERVACGPRWSRGIKSPPGRALAAGRGAVTRREPAESC